jgi:hypothetical protein
MIAELLIENTGSHFLDSGMHGRAWQMTRAKYGLDGGLPNSPFSGGPGHATTDPGEDEITRVARAMREAPSGWIDDWGACIVSAFHWLTDRLDYDPALDAKYRRWEEVTNYGKDRYDKDWGLPLMERFTEQLAKHGAHVGGVYGENGPVTDNTYNHESALDRTLQYSLFTIENETVGWIRKSRADMERAAASGAPTREDSDGTCWVWIEPPKPFLPDGAYVLLQIHGGADVRGGYTQPRLFTIQGEDDFFDDDRVDVWCEGAEEDVVPDGQADGQTQVVWTPEQGLHDGPPAQIVPDGGSHWHTEVLKPVHVEHRHHWDNSYGDGKLRLTWALDGSEGRYEDDQRNGEVLAFQCKEDETFEIDEYDRRSGITSVNVATKNKDGQWVCPFDGSPLRCGPNLVG